MHIDYESKLLDYYYLYCKNLSLCKIVNDESNKYSERQFILFELWFICLHLYQKFNIKLKLIFL